jgi:hypothetical protein
MKKLTILKSLIDFIWIVTCIPVALMFLFLAIYMFVEPEILNLLFETDDDVFKPSPLVVQIFGLLFIVLGFFTIYCVYVFRKTLRYFQKVKPFHDEVISNFYKIGYLLTGIGIGSSLLFFLIRVLFENKFKIHLGLSPYLMLVCLGLFFMVLSEVFKMAKYAKEENDLTI